MEKIAAWFKSRNITSHTIAAATVGLFGLYASDQQFRDFVLASLVNHPKIIGLVVTLAGIYAKYSGGHSAQGVMAEVPAAIAKIETDKASVTAAKP